jgi:hypothetical protein
VFIGGGGNEERNRRGRLVFMRLKISKFPKTEVEGRVLLSSIQMSFNLTLASA